MSTSTNEKGESASLSTKKMCRCDCDQHSGEFLRVRVTHPNHDWGEFLYCEAAIKEDVKRGLTVKLIDDIDELDADDLSEEQWAREIVDE